MPPKSVWEPGTVVGRFTLIATLAQGGMAEIWLARSGGSGGFAKLVVIKRMIGELESDPDSLEMFLTEARLAAQLSHPHVVQISELGDDAGAPYIVMEYLDGEDLSLVRRTGQKVGLPLFDHHATRLISMAAEGLHYAHTLVGIDGRALKIVHRDVSPQNIIITFGGSVKVVDFGIAKASSQHTQSGKLKGKIAYMSPEQARGEPLDARSDVFALGVVLFEVLTRTRLLPSMTDLEMLSTLGGHDVLPRPSERRADLPTALEAIVLKAMAKDRERRFQSAREFQEALDEWGRSAGKTVSSADLAEYLRTLFPKRIIDRRQLIETALKSELTPVSARHLQDALAKAGEGSSSRSQTRATQTHEKRRVAMTVVGVALVAGVLLAVAVKAMTSKAVEPAPPVVTRVVEAPKPGSLVITTMPSGATITIDGTERGRSPLTIPGLALGTHRIDAKLEGHEPGVRQAMIEREGDRVMMELALVPSAPVAVAPKEQPPAPETPERAEPKKRAPTRVATGKLTLRTVPWTTVFLGKQKLGDTPLVDYVLPAGKHTLRLVSPDTNTESSIEVEVQANETTVKKLRL